MSYPSSPTADELQFLDCLSKRQFCYCYGIAEILFDKLVSEHSLPTVTINSAIYVNITDFQAWATAQNLDTLWAGYSSNIKPRKCGRAILHFWESTDDDALMVRKYSVGSGGGTIPPAEPSV